MVQFLGRRSRALHANKRLMTTYYLGELLEQFWKQNSRIEAEEFLENWFALVRTTDIYKLKRFARTLWRVRTELLNWYEHRISTGPLESANGRIRLLQRRAFGYRDREFFDLCIYAMHERVYA
jgi:transposase